ncbi:MAG: hypothetical protein WD845_05590, partial [Pirellulales bacterium]
MARFGGFCTVDTGRASSRQRCTRRRPWIAIASLLCLALGLTSTAQAQVDTPAAREAREALRAVATNRQELASWNNLAYRLGLADAQYELRLGGRAEPNVLAATAKAIRAGAQGELADPAFQKLAEALERRASELQPVAADAWSAECARQANQHATVTPAAVQAARRELLARLEPLERIVPTIGAPGDTWGDFLSWAATRDLVFKDTRDLALLDRLEARWQGAPLVWDAPELVEASLAVQSYIPRYRAFLANETAEERAAAWNELGKLLSTVPSTASP